MNKFKKYKSLHGPSYFEYVYIYICWLVGFYGTSTLGDNLMPSPVYTYIYIGWLVGFYGILTLFVVLHYIYIYIYIYTI